MDYSNYDHAREEIRKALVQEYLKKHPNVREQDVLLACEKGELIIIDMASVLADMQMRRRFSHNLEKAHNLFAELSVHQDERWQDCVKSTQHSRQIVDCLHSSTFNYFDQIAWSDQHNFLKRQEGICARKTVQIHEINKHMAQIQTQEATARTSKARTVIIEYFHLVIAQLKSLHAVFSREVDLGEIFYGQANKYIQCQFTRIQPQSTTIHCGEIAKIHAALKGDKKVTPDKVLEFNESMLLETKNALEKSVDQLKTNLEARRVQFQEIWATVAAIQDLVQNLEEIQKLEAAGNQPSPEAPPTAEPENPMMKILKKFKIIKRE